uniref:Uncharacterized protein n=1 Tax=Eutreptiella gymnastica TaxID=73025 RepID=A0A7S1J4H5_9EUGL|mmetsp:Transcript_64542/g.114860  ORF Transcript_64542/g.114860 Transcript_64542/m.114860 type:complete len:111 (+) Transcript_64542:113-445(+)
MLKWNPRITCNQSTCADLGVKQVVFCQPDKYQGTQQNVYRVHSSYNIHTYYVHCSGFHTIMGYKQGRKAAAWRSMGWACIRIDKCTTWNLRVVVRVFMDLVCDFQAVFTH